MFRRRRRSRMPGKGLLVMVLAGTLAVLTMGMVAASWTHTFDIEGTVTVGHTRVGIYDYASWDPGPNYLEPGGAANPVNSPVDGTRDMQYVAPTASTTLLAVTGAATLLPLFLPERWPAFVQVENQASTHSINLGPVLFEVDSVMGEVVLPFYDGVREEFKNVYATYATGTTLVLGNGGTLPVHVTGLQVTDVTDPFGALPYAVVDRWDGFLWDGDSIAQSWGEAYPPGSMPTLEEFLVDWPYGETVQVHPGQVVELGVSIVFLDPGDGSFPTGANASVEFGVLADLWCEDTICE